MTPSKASITTSRMVAGGSFSRDDVCPYHTYNKKSKSQEVTSDFQKTTVPCTRSPDLACSVKARSDVCRRMLIPVFCWRVLFFVGRLTLIVCFVVAPHSEQKSTDPNQAFFFIL